MKADKVLVVDGFNDQPFGLGVPPFLAVEPRYTAGACWLRDSKSRVIYATIQDLRSGRKASLLRDADLVFVYAGVKEASPEVRPSNFDARDTIPELQDLFDYIAYLDCPKILAGPYALLRADTAKERFGVDAVVTGDMSKYAWNLLDPDASIDDVDPAVRRTQEDVSAFALPGAGLLVQNPGYPDFLSCSVELYRGCPSSSAGGCSFCHQRFYTTVQYRPVEDVLAEVSKISELGCQNIVLESPCFFSYFSTPTEDGGVQLDPAAIEKLLEGIGRVAPELRSVHISSINPRVVADNPDDAKKILTAVMKNCSSANFPTLEVITFDDEVHLQNNTPASSEQSRQAIEIMAEAAGSSRAGLPSFLPTVELVYGLAAENEETATRNLEQLSEMAERGLIRGVTARRLVPVPGTPIYKRDDIAQIPDLEGHMNALRERVNSTCESKLARPGELIDNVFAYASLDGSSLAQTVGINPVHLVVYGSSDGKSSQDVRVTGFSDSRLEAVVQPLEPRTVSRDILRLLPGMTEDRIDMFMKFRPEREDEFLQLFEDPVEGRRAASFFEFKKE